MHQRDLAEVIELAQLQRDLMGGAFDLDRAETSDEALGVLGRAIPQGSTAVIASVSEPAVEVIDGEMKKLGGDVTCPISRSK